MIQEFVQQVTDTIKGIANTMHTAIPGEIDSFDPAKCLAVVKPAMKFKKPDGTMIDYPKISGVPVVFPQSYGQKATIAYPVKPGDGCLIIVAEQSIDYWMYGQETGTDLRFDLTNAICIPGIFNKPNALLTEACNKNAIIADLSGTKVTIQSGKVTVDAALVEINGNVKVNGRVDSTGDMKAGSISLQNHTHPTPHGESGTPS